MVDRDTTLSMTTRRDCRLCHSTALTNVFSLTPTPPANELVASPKEANRQERFPLNLYFCNDCRHLQLLNVVDPKRLFQHYLYVSGTSPVFREHFADYCQEILSTYSPPKGALVVEIGSNDGTLLRCFQTAHLNVLGVDPAEEIAAQANASGIPTINGYFDPDMADHIVDNEGQAHIVVANNVCAHIDDLDKIMQSVNTLLTPDGVFVMEVSYLKEVIEQTLFDTIYHEHLDYHSVKPLQQFFAKHQLELIDVKSVSSHGGSIRAVAQRALPCPHRPVQPSVQQFIDEETKLGLYQAETFFTFAEKIKKVGAQLQSYLYEAKQRGESIAAFGFPAKATTLMHQFNIGPDVIDYVVDDNPMKQGLYSPGFGVPIVGSQHLQQHPPDHIIILAWNFADSITKKLTGFVQSGGQIIIPLPDFKVVSQHDSEAIPQI